MKTILALAVLAVFATAINSSVIKEDPTSRANLNVGVVGPRDRLLSSTTHYRAAIANSIQSQDVRYNGNASTNITAVQAHEIGGTQFAYAQIISGGLRQRNVTVRFTSSRSRGFNYRLNIYGR